MSTIVITPEALVRSDFRKVPVWVLNDADETFDEAYYYWHPATELCPVPSAINEINGDGVLIEITDYAPDLSHLFMGRGSVQVEPGMEIYVRP